MRIARTEETLGPGTTIVLQSRLLAFKTLISLFGPTRRLHTLALPDSVYVTARPIERASDMN